MRTRTTPVPEASAAQALAAVRLSAGATIVFVQRCRGGWWIAWRERDGRSAGTRVSDRRAAP